MALPRLSSFGSEEGGCPLPILRFKSKGQLHLGSPEVGDIDHKNCIPRYHVYLAFSRGRPRLYQRGRYPNIQLSANSGSRKAQAATDTPRKAPPLSVDQRNSNRRRVLSRPRRSTTAKS